jgi:pilus assembly protein CpaB
LLAALIVSLVASYLVYRVAGGQMRANSKTPTTQVVVASRDLEIGTLLKDSDFKMGSVAGAPPKGAILKTDALAGRGVVSMIYQGEPILESRLAAPGSGGGLAATIPPGMRACAVKVNDVVGVAGFVGLLAVVGQGVDGIEQAPPHGDHGQIGATEVLCGSVADVAHALLNGQILFTDAADASV